MATDGEHDLNVLRMNAAPALHAETFVYCTFKDGEVPKHAAPIGTFVEKEGMTAILTTGQARALGAAVTYEWALISLGIHSSLQAVGLIAAVSQELALKSIPCNVMSGYYHDHIFVPAERREEAVSLLLALGSKT